MSSIPAFPAGYCKTGHTEVGNVILLDRNGNKLDVVPPGIFLAMAIAQDDDLLDVPAVELDGFASRLARCAHALDAAIQTERNNLARRAYNTSWKSEEDIRRMNGGAAMLTKLMGDRRAIHEAIGLVAAAMPETTAR